MTTSTKENVSTTSTTSIMGLLSDTASYMCATGTSIATLGNDIVLKITPNGYMIEFANQRGSATRAEFDTISDLIGWDQWSDLCILIKDCIVAHAVWIYESIKGACTTTINWVKSHTTEVDEDEEEATDEEINAMVVEPTVAEARETLIASLAAVKVGKEAMEADATDVMWEQFVSDSTMAYIS